MRISIKNFSALGLVSLAIPSAWAGIDSGGGAGIVCRDSSGKIKSVKLLDLYQVELDGGQIARSDLPVTSQIASALTQFERHLAHDLRKITSSIKMNMLPPNITSSQRYDLGNNPVLIEDGCSPEWIAFYKDGKDSLNIVTRYYNLMSNTDKAALMLHEAVYIRKRLMANATDSESTRAIVGEAFKSSPDSNLIFEATKDIQVDPNVIVEGSPHSTNLRIEYTVRSDLLIKGPDGESWDISQRRFDLHLSCFNLVGKLLRQTDLEELSTATSSGTLSVTGCDFVMIWQSAPGLSIDVNVLDNGGLLKSMRLTNTRGPLGYATMLPLEFYSYEFLNF